MNKNVVPMNQSDNQKTIQDLMEDLNLYGQSSGDESDTISESIDLVVDQAIHGVDIRKRFPRFYKILLQNKKLRQQFIDALTALVSPAALFIDPYKESYHFDFSFLKRNINIVTGWPVFISQTQTQLMKILFASEPEYRTAVDPGAAITYTLLRKDFVLQGTTYTVLINSTLAESQIDELNVSLSLTSENTGQESVFPVHASLRWGEYFAELSVDQEGKHSLPNIPLTQVLNNDLTEVKSDLYLTLNSLTH